MNSTSSEELFRQAAETESGTPVSAGARIAHVRLAVESGRAFYVDLSAVSEDKRGALIAEIKELVRRASTPGSRKEANRSTNAPQTSV